MGANRTWRHRSRQLASELLESRQLLTSNILISEFVASNDAGLTDSDGDSSDWIEIHNASNVAIDLQGWHLTDDANELDKWTFPTHAIDAGQYIVVFASGKDRADAGAELHANFKLSAGGEFLAVVEPDGMQVSHAYDPFPQQSTDVSFGLTALLDLATPQFFDNPTPGAANADPITTPSAAISFSVTGRTFAEPFTLEITSPTADAEIRYSTDGSIPDENSDLYTAPLRVVDSLRIRARAFEPGKAAGPVNSQGYIELGSGLTDFEGGVFESNLPLMVFQSFGGNVHANASRLVPVSAVFINNDDGDANLLDEPEFAGRAGLRTRGQSSQGWPKKQYALEIWEEGNSDRRPIDSSLADDRAVPIFDLPAESDWVLNGPYSDKTQLNNFLTFNWSRAMGQYAPRTRLVEVFVKETSGALDYRTDYRGTYVLLEKIKVDSNRVDITPLSPNATEEPEISGGYIWKFDKDGAGDVNFTTTHQSRTGSGRPWKHVEPQQPPAAQRAWLKDHLIEFERVLYGAEFDDPTNGYAKYIDVDSWIDTWLLVEFTKNIDGFRLSTYYHKDLGGKIKQGPAWDFNLSLANANYLRGAFPDGWYHDDLSRGDYPYWDRLFDDSSFELRVRDRWFELRDTIFKTENLLGDVDNAVAQLSDGNPNLENVGPGEPSNPISRNYDRWNTLGNFLWPNCFFGSGACPPSPLEDRARPDSYDDYIFILKDFIERRAAWIDGEFRTPPVITPAGDLSDELVEVTISPTSGGTVYYTTDGSDPFDPANGVSATAIQYTQPFEIEENVVVQARTLRGDTWSGIAAETYILEIPTLAISELHYNPAPPTSTESLAGFSENDDFEFVELLNYGLASVPLDGMRFVSGINVVLANETLAPAERGVVVRNEAAFRQRYGGEPKVVGVYGDPTDPDLDSRLRNSGEQIVLLGSLGETVVDVTYEDSWYPLTDGLGFSLVRRESASLQTIDNPSSWRPSEFAGGSAGANETGTIPGPGDIVVNEVVSKSSGASADIIELYNSTNDSVSIGDFFLTAGDDDLTKHQVRAGTQIPAGGFLQLDAASLRPPLQFDARGMSLTVQGATTTGSLVGFREHVAFGALASGRSWGRVPTSVGADFAPLTSVTLGEQNSPPQIGPVVINEIQYHPLAGEPEFVELRNTTAADVPLDGWRLTGGINGSETRLRFSQDDVLPASGYAVLLQVSALDAASVTEQVTAFRMLHDLPSNVAVHVFSTPLDNGGERLVLQRPLPERGLMLEVDRIAYSDDAPWIERADGLGPSLSRVASDAFGNDPANWKSSTAGGTPGRANTVEDATPPTVPQNLASSILDGGDVGLAWSFSTELESRVEHYNVYRDGRLLESTTIPFVRDVVDWTDNATVTYQVAAVNTDGFESDWSTSVLVRASSTSFQQDVDGYDKAADARLRESLPDTNYGDSTRLVVDGNASGQVGNGSSSLFRWSDIGIPTNSVVVGATVSLNVTNDGDDFHFKSVSRTWDEMTVTWNQAADGQAWQEVGASGSSDIGPTVGTLVSFGRSFVTTSLNSAGRATVQDWLDSPADNYGLILVDAGESTDSVSVESSTGRTADTHPKLTIFHTPRMEQQVGDLNFDGQVNAGDVDLLHAAIRTGQPDQAFDLTDDGMVDATDVDFLLANVLGTLRGDADLDGVVGFNDFLLMSAAFGSQQNPGWGRGDFDGDDAVSFADFLLLSANFGKRVV